MIRRIFAALVAALILTGCNWLGIPQLGQRRAIVDAPGSQSCIDNGNVCAWNGAANPHQGDPHLAAHRSTHGSTGLYWPTLEPGDRIYIDDEFGHRHWYTLYVKRIVDQSCGSCANAGDLTLQTSATFEPGDAWLLHFGRG